jgi:pyruvate/2-oxoglutarate dehydrogenase complex dihydrolipoamide dehydrogenase (E3) component
MKNPLRRQTTARYDLVVVGMGSGGAIAADFAATELGLRVAAIERDRVGGDCLWTGCVPSKALLTSARVAHTVRHADHYAIGSAEPEIDLTAVWERIKAIQREIASTDDDPDRIRATGVELIFGEGRITGPREVTVGDRVLDTRFTLVCTGSRPLIPPIDGIADIDVVTSDNLFERSRPPDSMIIVGGGPIACELAQGLNRLGVTTTIVEMEDRLLVKDDPDHADRLLSILRNEGVDVRLGAMATKVRKGGDGIDVTLSTGDKVTAQALFAAAGRRPNVEALGLEELGIDVGPHGVPVDERSRTMAPTIYAVGDVNGRPQFTHTAAYDAVIAVRDMFFPGSGVVHQIVPWCTFTDPEVAHVGLTAAEAVEAHGKRKVGVHRLDLERNDRARTDGTTDGEIVIVTVGGRIVGGHAICPHAGELIHELALAIRLRWKLNDLAEIIHVYPTYSTGIGSLAADRAFGTARRYRALARAGRVFG